MGAEQIMNDKAPIYELEALGIEDTKAMLKHLTTKELLEAIQEQTGVIKDAQTTSGGSPNPI